LDANIVLLLPNIKRSKQNLIQKPINAQSLAGWPACFGRFRESSFPRTQEKEFKKISILSPVPMKTCCFITLRNTRTKLKALTIKVYFCPQKEILVKVIITVLVLCVLCLGCDVEHPTNETEKTPELAQIVLHKQKMVRLEGAADTPAPLEITSLQIDEDRLYILDGFKLQQAYIYDLHGKLVKLVGKLGQGPGEYRLPGGFSKTGDRIHLVHQGKNYSIFDLNGDFIHRRSKVHPGAVGNRIYPGPNGTAFVTFYSRATSRGSIFHVDQEGELIRFFSPLDDEFVLFWDKVSPMGNVFVTEQEIAQVFVHKYEVLFFDMQGKPTAKMKLASTIYNSPDFEAAKQLPRDKQKQRDFARAYTLVEGFYPLGNGYLTVLSYTHLGPDKLVMEYWDADFKGLGRSIVPNSEKVVGTEAEQILFYNGETSELIWRKPFFPPGSEGLATMKSDKLILK
jgi:hypothetical protein